MSLESSFPFKTVIVTGAGKGIGRALTKKLDSLGAIVYAISRNQANLTSLRAECVNVQTICVDLRDWEATRIAIQNINLKIDFLVNNAAVMVPGQFLTITSQDLDELFTVNFKAVVNVSQLVAWKMIQGGSGGSIVNISSMAGVKAMTTMAAFGSLKSALNHLTKVMAVELGPHGIRVNAVNPGAINRTVSDEEMKTYFERVDSARIQEEMKRVPLKHKSLIEVDEVVNAVLFCLSNLASSISGSILPVDGGMSAN